MVIFVNILICDDMRPEADKLSGLLSGSGFELNISVFTSAKETLAFIRSGAVVASRPQTITPISPTRSARFPTCLNRQRRVTLMRCWVSCTPNAYTQTATACL
jgi:hypothetical protein